ncbi:universal stress protein UspA [Pollutimonas subterranea]|uniref:Universal stress protein UspA n=1 Tax=Pollutimonas subterranea TaxID=2045210 RepID=A0A2N4U0M8_9BURK|nr:universal stress protein [Pollutimonas subterranea]PLC48575.1 universal stress protein UspA [Pollutimonas subterranea]
MSKILACVDASPYAMSVCDLTAWLASRLKSDIELLHVVQRKSAVASRHDYSGAIGLGVKSELLEELTRIEEAQGKLAVKSGRALLDAAQARVRTGADGNIELVHLHGGIIETILEREAETELVIMGKRGASSEYATAHTGSKIERILRASKKPLVIAPQQFLHPENVVIAYDGGKSILRALEYVASSPLFDGMPIHLIMAGEEPEARRAELERALLTVGANGRKADWTLLPGAPDKVIADYMADRPGSMLIMGAHGHSPLRTLIVGSTTTAVVRAVHAPILLVR